MSELSPDFKLTSTAIQIMEGGLLTISFIILQNLLFLTGISTSQWIALLSFCVAIPLLGGALFVNVMSDGLRSELPIQPFLVGVLTAFIILGPILDLLGISAVMWHLSHIACIIFMSTVILVTVFCLVYFNKVSESLVVNSANVRRFLSRNIGNRREC